LQDAFCSDCDKAWTILAPTYCPSLEVARLSWANPFVRRFRLQQCLLRTKLPHFDTLPLRKGFWLGRRHPFFHQARLEMGIRARAVSVIPQKGSFTKCTFCCFVFLTARLQRLLLVPVWMLPLLQLGVVTCRPDEMIFDKWRAKRNVFDDGQPRRRRALSTSQMAKHRGEVELA
jgi:hypothetical protein